MNKLYCDICKKEIKHSGNSLLGTNGKVAFNFSANIVVSEGGTSGDLCLDCAVKALNAEVYKKTKRPYKKPAKVTPESIAD